MPDVISLLMPGDANEQTIDALRADLVALPQVGNVGADRTRSVDSATVMMWVSFAADAIGLATSAVTIIQAIRACVQSRGIRGVVMHLPNGVKVTLDSATPEEINLVAQAWKPAAS